MSDRQPPNVDADALRFTRCNVSPNLLLEADCDRDTNLLTVKYFGNPGWDICTGELLVLSDKCKKWYSAQRLFVLLGLLCVSRLRVVSWRKTYVLVN